MTLVHRPLWRIGWATAALALASCQVSTEGDGVRADVVDGGGGRRDATLDRSTADDPFPTAETGPSAPVEGKCFPGLKPCSGRCLADDKVELGCALPECSPCNVPNANAVCANGTCSIGSCQSGPVLHGDCNGAPADGCETELNSLTNCAECGKGCAIANGTPTCSTGKCSVSKCNEKFGDCDGDGSNGCEKPLTTLTNCGKCGQKCAVDGGIPTCAAGECRISTCTNTLIEDCNRNVQDGCETRLDTISNCGGCGMECVRANATTTCPGGECTILDCKDGFKDCDGNPSNGCETNVALSPLNCGGCGHACSKSHSVGQSCVLGKCVHSCVNLWGDCNGPRPGNTDDGCESDTSTDPANCGKCARPCSDKNVGTISCNAGRCASSCLPGWGNCFQPPSIFGPDDGCETNTNSGVYHCGACGRSCSTGEVDDLLCSNGRCTSTCKSGRSNCRTPAAPTPDDGCETNTSSDTSNCGSCSNACPSDNGEAHCSQGDCSISCKPGWDDCDRSSQNGCETRVDTTMNCGKCGRACANTHVAGALSCTNGLCDTKTCEQGWSNVTMSATPDDGCEQVEATGLDAGSDVN